jgi:hypothetical protein
MAPECHTVVYTATLWIPWFLSSVYLVSSIVMFGRKSLLFAVCLSGIHAWGELGHEAVGWFFTTYTYLKDPALNPALADLSLCRFWRQKHYLLWRLRWVPPSMNLWEPPDQSVVYSLRAYTLWISRILYVYHFTVGRHCSQRGCFCLVCPESFHWRRGSVALFKEL